MPSRCPALTATIAALLTATFFSPAAPAGTMTFTAGNPDFTYSAGSAQATLLHIDNIFGSTPAVGTGPAMFLQTDVSGTPATLTLRIQAPAGQRIAIDPPAPGSLFLYLEVGGGPDNYFTISASDFSFENLTGTAPGPATHDFFRTSGTKNGVGFGIDGTAPTASPFTFTALTLTATFPVDYYTQWLIPDKNYRIDLNYRATGLTADPGTAYARLESIPGAAAAPLPTASLASLPLFTLCALRRRRRRQ